MNRSQIRLLLPLGAAIVLSLPGDQTLYAVLPNQIEVVGVSLGVVGVLLGVNRLIRIPGNVLTGALNDRFGRRNLFLCGMFLGMISTASYGLVRGFWPLLAGRMLWGIAWSLINVSGLTMLLDRSSPADRGRMAGFYQVAYMLGLSISPLLGGMLTEVLGFRSALRICAAITGVGLAIAFVALPETRIPVEEARHGVPRDAPRPSLMAPIGALWRTDRRILRANFIYLVTLFVSNGVLMSTISLYLRQRFGTSISLSGAVIGVNVLAGATLAARALVSMSAGFGAGAMSDRFSSRWPVVRGGICTGIIGFLCLILPIGDWAVPVGVILIALSTGALMTTLIALVGDLADRSRPGVTMGSLATAGDIGSAAGPLLAYALLSIVDLQWVYLFCVMALTLALIASVKQKTAH